jgi:hypothetical protein
MRIIAAAVCALVAVGCAHPALIPPSWVGTDRARQGQYLHFARFVEDTPDAVDHEAVRDEALLKSLDGEQACVELTERTGVAYDEPIADLQPVCKTAVKTAAAVSKEVVSVADYDFQTREVVMRVRQVSLLGYSHLTIVEPTQSTFRVIERRAEVCCPTGGGRAVRLTVKNPRMRVNDVGVSYGEEFAWSVE